MKPIRTKRLILRDWQERDLEIFHTINSDDRVLEFFPFRRNRAEAEAKMREFQDDITAHGFGWSAAEIAETGACIGFIGLQHAELEPLIPADTLQIGWRLAPEFWGFGYVTEGASALLDFAFDELGQEEIVSFAVWNNHRSTAVMERLGMRRAPDFDNPRTPDSHPHLKRHALYRLSRDKWRNRKRAAG